MKSESSGPVFANTREGFENFAVQPHHYMVFELTPNYQSDDGQTTHNRHGFRGPAFEPIKPEGVYRIVCMGESTTYCTGVRDDETYPIRLQHHLAPGFPRGRLEVINAAVPAYTSAENVIQFIFRVQPLAPDLIIYFFAHNDLTARRSPQLSRDYREFTKVWGDPIWGDYIKPSRWPAWLTGIFRRRRKIDHAVGIARLARHYNRLDYANIPSNTTAHFRDNLRTLAALARFWNIQMMFILPSYPPVTPKMKGNKKLRAEATEEHRRIAAAVASEFDAWQLDLGTHTGPGSGGPPREDLYFDPSHLNSKGCDWVGKLAAEFVSARLLSSDASKKSEPPASTGLI